MRSSAKRSTSGRLHPFPRTLVGQWLRALTLAKADVHPPLEEQISRANGWALESRASQDAVMHEAFSLVIRRRFSDDTDVRDITRWVAAVRESQGSYVMPVLAGATMVRAALGEDLPTESIPVLDRFYCRGFLFLGAFNDLYLTPDGGGWDESELDRILTTAEWLAEEKGFHPLLAVD
jgi:hypothetical protein